MQTRRKSLNLGDLGVVAPKRSRTTIAHPSPPETVYEGEERPVKKSKQSHGSASPPPGLMSPPRTTVIRLKEEKPKRATELSPPPSPVAEGNASKIDFEGINDDIVIGTLQQIEKTGNRPHLVKELAAVLATKLHCVEKSANPSALISSRLTAYLNRTWPPVSPCPLAKDLSPVHPRRLYFYLTTTPHQPIPETVIEPFLKANRIISPSLSSASAADEENEYTRRREVLSPSPEVDLSSPELEEDHGDAPPTPGGSFSGRNSISRDRSASYTHPRRNASPPLETEEQDFKQTASALYEEAQKRRNSQHSQQDVNMDGESAGGADQDGDSVTMSIEPEETEESAALKNSEAAAALFGPSDHMQVTSAQQMEFSSPLLRPQNVDLQDDTDHVTLSFGKDDHISVPEAALGWDSLQSPEDIEVEDLDDMFDAY
ncbi:hypothetical protein DOTSEDRAFT_156204 [Dothistroma septosporum NZE10]|uniref:GDS1 winged helix domain-containing protein n=1 Tax=Dothistroma septosporum (strain NZE10 / CBS 128990) TaxID=675120 RepID=N1PGX5_DOTSN|nr:hypothetical protein DOTSEDRAFT_156204 [Dothistroma septosporum NZE10]